VLLGGFRSERTVKRGENGMKRLMQEGAEEDFRPSSQLKNGNDQQRIS
jgi:hypothetical protein